MLVSAFDYDLPPASIAQSAIEPRDAARLLVTDGMHDRVFRDLPGVLAPGDLLVVNRTRVRAARLRCVRSGTGGALEVLLTRRVDQQHWEALIRPARRIRPGVRFACGPIAGEVVDGAIAGVVTVRLSADGDVEDVIAVCGDVPLPPYFTGSLNDPERYQTLFAKTVGSAAASTAALHFTPTLVDEMIDHGIARTEVDLEIGLDTFRPMAVERLDDHVIHTEHYTVPEDTAIRIDDARRTGGRIVAVGTTVVRTLETAGRPDGTVAPGSGESALFIRPGHRFGVVDALITNFHAPRTTLVALVAAALGETWRDVYATALDRGYRFLSFGDAMLIEGMRTT
jgi:S-adenosylmethionine:tRNA ribosyltransferase-isomerase